jgi:hypothetical protein
MPLLFILWETNQLFWSSVTLMLNSLHLMVDYKPSIKSILYFTFLRFPSYFPFSFSFSKWNLSLLHYQQPLLNTYTIFLFQILALITHCNITLPNTFFDDQMQLYTPKIQSPYRGSTISLLHICVQFPLQIQYYIPTTYINPPYEHWISNKYITSSTNFAFLFYALSYFSQYNCFILQWN